MRMPSKLRQNFFRTLALTCLTMAAVVCVRYGNLDHGMSAGNCIILMMLLAVTFASFVATVSSGAVRTTAKAASQYHGQATLPSHQRNAAPEALGSGTESRRQC